MGLAEYFDKAALAAFQVVSGADYGQLAARLESEVVGVSWDGSAVGGEGRASLELLVNLLSRLYPRLALLPLDEPAESVADHLAQLASAINPNLALEPPSVATRQVVVGSTAVRSPAIYIGSSGWTARAGSDGPLGSSAGSNLFGAGVAACVGAAVLFRDVFADRTPSHQPRGSLEWRILDSECLDLPPIHFDDVYLAGVGAIGNAAIWALARIGELRGTLHVVDPETVALSNLQRYVLTNHSDVGQAKVDLAADAIDGKGVEIVRHESPWAEVASAAGHRLGLVLTALDSADARCEVQASLPKHIVNAWTQQGDLGISRHDFLGDQACLMCLYLPTEKRPGEDVLIARALGLPDAAREIREMLAERRPVQKPLLERIASAKHVPLDPLLAFEGHSMREFYSEGVCGGLLLRLGDKLGEETRGTAPLAHQSALAGLLLAGEAVAYALGLRREHFPTVTRYDVMRPYIPPVETMAAKDASGRCICRDPDYIQAFIRKHRVVQH